MGDRPLVYLPFPIFGIYTYIFGTYASLATTAILYIYFKSPGRDHFAIKLQ